MSYTGIQKRNLNDQPQDSVVKRRNMRPKRMFFHRDVIVLPVDGSIVSFFVSFVLVLLRFILHSNDLTSAFWAVY